MLARLRCCIDIALIPCLFGEPRLWFEHFLPTDDAVVDLLGVVMAAREPLSSAHLDSLGLLGAQDGISLTPSPILLLTHGRISFKYARDGKF